MVEEEFKTWLSDAHRRFPEAFKWFLAEKPRETQAETNRSWFECLDGCGLADCLAANLAIQRGDTDWSGKLDLFPQAVRKYCSRRSESRSRIAKPQTRHNPISIFGWREVVAEVLSAKDNGVTDDAIRQRLEQFFSTVPQRGDRGPRYSCRWCHDRGIVFVVAARIIKHVSEYGSTTGYKGHREEAMRCSCKAGETKDENALRFSQGYDLQMPRGKTDQELLADIKDWLAIQRQSQPARGKEWSYA